MLLQLASCSFWSQGSYFIHASSIQKGDACVKCRVDLRPQGVDNFHTYDTYLMYDIQISIFIHFSMYSFSLCMCFKACHGLIRASLATPVAGQSASVQGLLCFSFDRILLCRTTPDTRADAGLLSD